MKKYKKYSVNNESDLDSSTSGVLSVLHWIQILWLKMHCESSDYIVLEKFQRNFDKVQKESSDTLIGLSQQSVMLRQF